MEAKRILTALAILALAAPFALAQTVIDNFEEGEFTSNPTWTAVENAGGSQSVTAATAYNGQNAVLLTTDGADDNAYNRLETPLDSAYVYDGNIPITARIHTGTNAADRHVALYTSTNDQVYAGLTENGSFEITFTNDNTSEYSAVFDTNTWYNINFIVDESANSAQVQIKNQQGTILHSDTGTFSGTISNIQMRTQDTTASASNTYFDYLTYNETPLNDFQFSMKSVSTTGSNGSDAFYLGISDMQYPFGKVDGSGGETGYFSLASGTVSTETFEIQNVQVTNLVYPNENNQPNKAEFQVNYTVVSSEGFTGVSNALQLERGNAVRTGSCNYTSVSAEARAYTCTVPMEFYDQAGTYDVNITYTAHADTIQYYNADQVTYGTLVASQRIGNSVSFNNAGPGKVNVRSDNQIKMKNTGNAQMNFTLTAYDLKSRQSNDTIDAENFKAGNASVSTAITLQDATAKTVTDNYAPGPNQEQAYWFWLTMPAELPPNDYYSPNPWKIQGVES